jgi:hypothetical protein
MPTGAFSRFRPPLSPNRGAPAPSPPFTTLPNWNAWSGSARICGEYFARTAHSAGRHSRVHRNPARRRVGRSGEQPQIPGDHRGAHHAAHQPGVRSVDALGNRSGAGPRSAEKLSAVELAENALQMVAIQARERHVPRVLGEAEDVYIVGQKARLERAREPAIERNQLQPAGRRGPLDIRRVDSRPSGFPSRTTESAFRRRRTCRAFSSAFTAWTKPDRARPEEPAWACPSCATPWSGPADR